MKVVIFYLLLLVLGARAAFAQSNDITGEMNIVPGATYQYTYTGSLCGNGTNTLYWGVTGGTYVQNSPTTISVTWDCSAANRDITVDVYGEDYAYDSDSGYGYYNPIYCGYSYINGFVISSPSVGAIVIPYNFSGNYEVCPNLPVTLDYEGSIGIHHVNWYQWDGAAWIARGTAMGGDFPMNFPAITSPTIYKAQAFGCDGAALVAQTITIGVKDLSAYRGVALGSRDVIFGNNTGVVTLAECQGFILNWQSSEDGGGTWKDIPETSEQLTYSDLTITTQFRAISFVYLACGNIESLPCTIRVGNEDLNWVENKKFGDNGVVVSNSRTYFDLTGRLLQTQSRNLSQGKILVTQPLVSQYDQIVGSTLPAPILETEFTYKPRFVTPTFTASLPYDYKQFDAGLINNPVPVGSSIGTLGWYYSTNNTLEPNTPITAYPYSRSEEAPDGSTGVVRSSGVGEKFRMGQGKENVQGTFPVQEELNTYAQLRNRYFPTTIMGEQITRVNAANIPTFGGAAVQQVGINSNGQKTVSFQDKDGHTVMVARPGHTTGWENVTNTVVIGWPYFFVKDDNQRYETPVFDATADIKVYDANYALVFEGHARDFDLSSYTALCRIYSNEPFRIVTGRIFNASTGQPVSWNSMYEFVATKRESYAYYNFYTFETASASVANQISGSDYTVKNTITGADVTSAFKNNAAIPDGFYQIKIIRGTVNLTYNNSYQDISYSFYNQKGQLLGSLAPNGAQKVTTDLRATNLSTYPTVAALPFYTSYEYDVRGRMLAMNETDAGRTQYYYRTDGKIRFSQNAKQAPDGYFSYTNYDDIGRPVESGECRPVSKAYFATIAESAAILENTEPRGGFALDQPRQDAVFTLYDLPATVQSGFANSAVDNQTFLFGNVSSTKLLDSYIPQNALPRPVAQSWFSYDEQGRTKWLSRSNNVGPSGSNPYTLEYDYDSNGKALTVAYNSYSNNAAPRFTHYYSYDADQRLSEVRTNEVVPTNQTVPRTLRASYSYYLHGPVKRVVLGGLQGLDYRYTVQGWLKSINGVPQGGDPGNDDTSTTGMLPDLFSQELEYYAGDYASRQQPQGTFTASSTYPERFDGTLQASAWRTPSHPGLHGYGYQYDERGQLHQADYGQPLAGANGNLAFTADVAGRYSEGNLDYDPNGNLKSLRRTDRFGAFLMNINYQYLGNTNKLNWVRPNPTTPLLDYTYDELGQLKSQQEAGKNLYFTYNARGKVTEVYSDAAKLTLVAKYTYDEFGQRMQQDNSSGTLAFSRDAAGHEVASYYFNSGNDDMELYEQPIYGAARIGVVRQPRADNDQPGGQLYELSDQLGNTRVVFQAPHTDKYLLTMEDGKTDQEKQDFPTPDVQPNQGATYNAVRTSKASLKASPYGSGYSMDLVARVGPGKKLSVAPGDRILMEVWAAYPSSTGGPILGRSLATELPKIGLVLGSVNPMAQPRPSDMTGTRPLPAWQQLLSQLSVGVAIPLSSRRAKTNVPSLNGMTSKVAGAPNAGLHYLLRSVRTHGVVGSGYAPVTVDSEGNWRQLKLDLTVTAEEPCEMELWLDNQDQSHVYFDDLKVEHQVGPIIQENHFYAYGQRNEGLSWARQNLRGYGRGYQGQNTRFDEETSYDNFELRMYDSRIGRWTSTDPMAQYHSPYVGMGNDPINDIDPDGGEAKTDFYTNSGKLVRHVEDGSNAIFYQTGSGANLHYEFGGFGGAGTNFTINPGSVLEQQQVLNNSNANLAAGAGPGGTHCSEATRDVMMAAGSAYGNSSAIIPGPSANEMYSQLAKASGWSEATQNQALAYAKAGGLSVITYKNPTGGHGHIATYAVGGNVHKYSYLWKGKTASDMGVISNIGPKAYSGSVSIRRSFSTLSTKSYIYTPSR